MDDGEGWWTRTTRYGDHVFASRCPACARFVKMDKVATVMREWGELKEPNATCSLHGRVKTPFLAWAGDCWVND